MRIPSFLPLAFMSLLLGACATPSTTLQNANGQTVTCSSSGWGYVGAPAALISHSNCVDEMQAKGYRAVDKAVATPKASEGAKDVKFDLPGGWEYKQAPDSLKDGVYALNKVKDLGAYVTAVSGEGLDDLMAYAMARRDNQLSLVRDGMASEIGKFEISGRLALRYEVTGFAKNGMKVTYITTIIRGSKQVGFVNVWSTAPGVERNRAELESMASRVVGLS